jgi:hypothetical protein
MDGACVSVRGYDREDVRDAPPRLAVCSVVRPLRKTSNF